MELKWTREPYVFDFLRKKIWNYKYDLHVYNELLIHFQVFILLKNIQGIHIIN